MKNECYIVRDLLPSYIDHLCSEESSRFIEQHVATCEQCAQVVKQMRVEFDVQDQSEVTASIKHKKPFQKIGIFFNAQKKFTTFLKLSFWVSFLVTVGFTISSLNMLTDFHNERDVAQVVEQQKRDILERSLAVLSTKNTIDESALQEIFQQYSGQLQHLAVFSTDNIDDFTRLQEGPTNTFPIDYSHAALVIGKNGEITESIIPNDYDIGTVAMANEQWIVQYEYQESYLETVENAHQIKYYPPTNWIIFQLPIVFIILTVFILGNWLFLKRITKPVKNILN